MYTIYKSIILISVALMILLMAYFPDFVTQTGYTYLASFLVIICAISFAMHYARNKVSTKSTIIHGLGLAFVIVLLLL